jgi:DNA-binding NarL/FixJ family response regulator
VYVVDDHPVVLAGLVTLLGGQQDMEVVGSASSGEQALAELARTPSDVVLVDHRLGAGMDGVELCDRLTDEPYSLRCLALSAGTDALTLRAFVAAGASGFLPKQVDPARIVAAVRAVASGGLFVDSSLTSLMISTVHESRLGVSSLSRQEHEVLRYVGLGMSNQEIGDALCVSHSSAKSYVSALLRKLDVNTRAEAAAIAAQQGLLDAKPGGAS